MRLKFFGLLVMVGFSNLASAGSFECMREVVCAESDGTTASMLGVGKTVNRRVQLGEGSVCTVARAPGQFVAYGQCAGKTADWRARAAKVAAHLIATNLSHPFREFRTTAFTKHRGVVIGGNTYFNTSTGDNHRRRHRSFARRSSRRPVAYNAPSNLSASLFGEEEGAR